MSDHQLRLTGHPLYGWTLDCTHTSDDARWLDPTGEYPGCTVQSWWDEMGMEIISDDERLHPWPMPQRAALPVDVVWLGDGDGPMLVPATKEASRG